MPKYSGQNYLDINNPTNVEPGNSGYNNPAFTNPGQRKINIRSFEPNSVSSTNNNRPNFNFGSMFKGFSNNINPSQTNWNPETGLQNNPNYKYNYQNIDPATAEPEPVNQPKSNQLLEYLKGIDIHRTAGDIANLGSLFSASQFNKNPIYPGAFKAQMPYVNITGLTENQKRGIINPSIANANRAYQDALAKGASPQEASNIASQHQSQINDLNIKVAGADTAQRQQGIDRYAEIASRLNEFNSGEGNRMNQFNAANYNDVAKSNAQSQREIMSDIIGNQYGKSATNQEIASQKEKDRLDRLALADRDKVLAQLFAKYR